MAHLDKADLLAMDGPCSGGVAIDERPVDVLELSLGDACLTVPWDTRRL